MNTADPLHAGCPACGHQFVPSHGWEKGPVGCPRCGQVLSPPGFAAAPDGSGDGGGWWPVLLLTMAGVSVLGVLAIVAVACVRYASLRQTATRVEHQLREAESDAHSARRAAAEAAQETAAREARSRALEAEKARLEAALAAQEALVNQQRALAEASRSDVDKSLAALEQARLEMERVAAEAGLAARAGLGESPRVEAAAPVAVDAPAAVESAKADDPVKAADAADLKRRRPAPRDDPKRDDLKAKVERGLAGKKYVIVVENIEVAPAKADGGQWDHANSPPDPVVTIRRADPLAVQRHAELQAELSALATSAVFSDTEDRLRGGLELVPPGDPRRALYEDMMKRRAEMAKPLTPAERKRQAELTEEFQRLQAWLLAVSPVASDRLTHDYRCESLAVEPGETVEIVVTDKDVLFDDLIGSRQLVCAPEVLKAGAITLEFGLVRKLRLSFRPLAK